MYQIYDLSRAAADPISYLASLTRDVWSHPLVPASYTPLGQAIACASDVLARATRRYPKVPFGIDRAEIEGRSVEVQETVALETPFCDLVRFEREVLRNDPKVLLVAPLSGQHATVLRDTVARLVPGHDVYVTDWIDARTIPLSAGRFGLDDYVALLQRFLRHIGPDVHVIAVCQPAVPVLAAVSLLAEEGDPASPRSLTLLSGPVDARVNPTLLDLQARAPLALFRLAAVHRVPLGNAGFLRRVYPGFLQLAAYTAMTASFTLNAERDLYREMVGEEASREEQRRFYADFMSVMDVPAEFYLDTVRTVFQRHALARGEMTWRGKLVRPALIRSTSLFTVEGADDAITAVGQTAAAHALCSSIPPERKQRYVAPGVGHFGVFSGRCWREDIAPRVIEFIRAARRVPRPLSVDAAPRLGPAPAVAVAVAG
ncbi:MAG: polyhydroxyalkanoate depolymerase [Anaeromyxobacteraceae bacterium]